MQVEIHIEREIRRIICAILLLLLLRMLLLLRWLLGGVRWRLSAAWILGGGGLGDFGLHSKVVKRGQVGLRALAVRLVRHDCF